MEELDPKWIRVSSVLSMIPTMENGKWGYPMQRIDQDLLQRKAQLGSNVHALIASHLKNEFVVLEGKEERYFESYMIWYNSVQPEPLHIEKRFFYDPMRLTGCVDVITSDKDGLLHLVDFKCTVQADKTKWPLQAAFYRLLAGVNGTKVQKETYFIQLQSDGSAPTVHEFIITEQLTGCAISWYNAYVYLTENKQ